MELLFPDDLGLEDRGARGTFGASPGDALPSQADQLSRLARSLGTSGHTEKASRA